MLELLRLAGQVALPTNVKMDMRQFWVGVIGIRRDNVLVSAKNGSAQATDFLAYKNGFPPAHAEARCCRKMDNGGVIYVARVAKGTRLLALARPCVFCVRVLRSKDIRRVYYTISNEEYGVWDLYDNERLG